MTWLGKSLNRKVLRVALAGMILFASLAGGAPFPGSGADLGKLRNATNQTTMMSLAGTQGQKVELVTVNRLSEVRLELNRSTPAVSEPSDISALSKRELLRRGRKHELQSRLGFWVSLINATPYRWQLIRQDAKKIRFVFTEKFARYIEPGQQITLHMEPEDKDSTLQVQYLLMGTKKPMWFTMSITDGFLAGGIKGGPNGNPHLIRITYGGFLETVGSKMGSELDLGVMQGTGCASFYLSGNEDRFFSSDAPYNWMHTMMGDIGHLSLNQITLPRAHHAGMYAKSHKYGLGNEASTMTQNANIYTQLTKGGARVLDFRPIVFKDGRIYESHGTKIGGLYHGMSGVSLRKIIEQVNKFNKDYPGELIIVDLFVSEMRQRHGFKKLDAEGRAYLFDQLKGFDHRLHLDDSRNIGQIPLRELIPDGKSGVIIRVHSGEIPREEIPSAYEGFSTMNFGVTKHWTDTNSFRELVRDQIKFLHRFREYADPASDVYMAEFQVTPQLWDIIALNPIVDLNAGVAILLSSTLWPALQGQYFPNWLGMDRIQTPELRGIVFAINQCLASLRCGTMGGRVPLARPVKGILPSPATYDPTAKTVLYRKHGSNSTMTTRLDPALPDMTRMKVHLYTEADAGFDVAMAADMSPDTHEDKLRAGQNMDVHEEDPFAGTS